MKRLIFLFVMALGFQGIAQKLPKIKGSGIVELKEVEVSEPYHSVSVDGDIEVLLHRGNGNFYSVETDDNLIEAIDFTIQDSTLQIALNSRIVRKKKLEIVVELDELKSLLLENGAAVKSQNTLKGNDIYVEAGKSTKFDLDIESEYSSNIKLYSNADGEVTSKSIISNIKLEDRASLKYSSVNDSIHLKAKDNVRIQLDGSYKNANMMASATSKIDTRKASISNAIIELSDNADALLNVTENIDLFAQDNSTLELYGDPEISVSGLKNKARIFKKE